MSVPDLRLVGDDPRFRTVQAHGLTVTVYDHRELQLDLSRFVASDFADWLDSMDLLEAVFHAASWLGPKPYGRYYGLVFGLFVTCEDPIDCEDAVIERIEDEASFREWVDKQGFVELLIEEDR